MTSSATLGESELALTLGFLPHLHRPKEFSLIHDPLTAMPFLVTM